ncbi:hypothetical protein HMPREF0539_1139 [Lacticaseibacillus rhamnosus LMS2-1]|uniref:Uncharacterized protein n=1 Tax=Lacticaseibacillus rhamnosus (strain LMS2-1) TaxID=525361 RepID=C2JW55_LACRM|nr:hypothetical protein LRHK_1076 [Lacticaseibacillus rhamnosus ATCC 8530]EEN80722.1 hypothetical protein HMPREF0539_1139 [Lacticaseibacillus rhamnosus LMS2-1]
MAKPRPSRPRPLTLRSLTAPAHAHTKKVRSDFRIALFASYALGMIMA